MKNSFNKIKIGVVGLGQRGKGLLETLLAIDAFEIVAVCDRYQDRVDNAFEMITKQQAVAPRKYADFEAFIKDEEMQATLIASSWDAHVGMAIRSMEEGKITAMEVGGAHSIEECWALVDTYEKTKTPIMFLENCCYNSFELLATHLARKNMFGEIVHCHGAYSHDLRAQILGGNVNRHYRLKNYIERNCDNYPTHNLGPIARLLNINRGNRMVKLVTMASKARGVEAFSHTEENPDKSLEGQKFNQGDIVKTLITCENGELISLTLDTTLPKYYSREFTVRGTKGLANQEANMIFLEEKHSSHEYWEPQKTIGKYLNNADDYYGYLPYFWKNINDLQRNAGHGGMDYFMLEEFAKAVQAGADMPIDVYDAAAWMSITPLSAIAIQENRVVEIPDFTRGKWVSREPKDVINFDE